MYETGEFFLYDPIGRPVVSGLSCGDSVRSPDSLGAVGICVQ